MRIISEFKDYYDCISQYGINSDLLYIRKSEEYSIKNLEIPLSNYNKKFFRPVKLTLLMFCGKSYPLYSLSSYHHRGGFSCSKKECYRFPQSWESSRNIDSINKEIDIYFDYVETNGSKLSKQLEYINIPCFMVEYYIYDNIGDVTTNVNLKMLDFQKIKPPNEAFQDIQIYLSKIAKPEKTIPEMDNQTKIDSRGFNKFSFRRDKSVK
jgi:hypothetical protein